MASRKTAAATPDDDGRCKNCGACKECGAGAGGGRGVTFIPYPYPVYPQPVIPATPPRLWTQTWPWQPVTWGTGSAPNQSGLSGGITYTSNAGTTAA